jgi:hypothetical protein
LKALLQNLAFCGISVYECARYPYSCACTPGDGVGSFMYLRVFAEEQGHECPCTDGVHVGSTYGSILLQAEIARAPDPLSDLPEECRVLVEEGLRRLDLARPPCFALLRADPYEAPLNVRYPATRPAAAPINAPPIAATAVAQSATITSGQMIARILQERKGPLPPRFACLTCG